MAGVLLLGIASASLKVHDLVQDKRSPLLPSPPMSEGLSPHITVRSLKRCHRAWDEREAGLSTRVLALKTAKKQGLEVCYAGRVSTLRAARRARDEARWVRMKLAEAIAWCDSQQDQVKKGSYMLLFKSKSERPAFSASPPSLFDLPIPLPMAQPANIYTLTVDRSGIIDPPPTYCTDLPHGEKTIERTELEEWGDENEDEENTSLASSPSSTLNSYIH